MCSGLNNPSNFLIDRKLSQSYAAIHLRQKILFAHNTEATVDDPFVYLNVVGLCKQNVKCSELEIELLFLEYFLNESGNEALKVGSNDIPRKGEFVEVLHHE